MAQPSTSHSQQGLYFTSAFNASSFPQPQPSSGRKSCNCKNSRCLKLYCECFASGDYCRNCNCNCCCNNVENESIRKETVSAILERNPNAFRPKIANLPPSSP